MPSDGSSFRGRLIRFDVSAHRPSSQVRNGLVWMIRHTLGTPATARSADNQGQSLAVDSEGLTAWGL